MSYMEFTNPGEVPINAFKLLGASTKRNDESKIGFFGTGLKYAIAVMLREGVDFKIFVGEKEVKIGTRATDFAGQKIQVMTVNGEKTSITIDAGINWEPWFAIREIYSNAVDEGGIMKLADDIKGTVGSTSIFVEMSEKLGDVSTNWQHYFAFKRSSLFDDGDGNRILGKLKDPKFTMFRKGIRVDRSHTNSLFDYDIKNIKINESRVASVPWEVKQSVAEVLAKCSDEGVIRTLIASFRTNGECYEAQTSTWEYLFDGTFGGGTFNEAWFEILKDKRIVPIELSGFYGITTDTVVMPQKLIRHLHKAFGDRLSFIGHTQEKYLLIGEYDSKLDESHELLAKNGYTYDKESIKIGKFQDRSVKGLWDNTQKMIIISEDVLTPAYANERTAILLEEITHATTGFDDNSRELQSYLFDVIVGMMQEKVTA